MIDALDRQRWLQIDALFDQALERASDERTAFLRAACGDDPVLYQAVSELLALEAQAGRSLGESVTEFLDPLLPELRQRLEDPSGATSGTTFGPYRVERQIGRGGMGNVYLAERADGAFHKQVALKLVRKGLDSEEVLRRFRRERQLLAGLDHSNIARLLDGGVAGDGRPYLVMEYVAGKPITLHCDQLRLPVERRLDLFEQVCAAVQHAHRRLVVHRDLKPSNVLVTADDEVKLLDFGIAKVLAADSDEDALLTRGDLRLLTPEYAAPEQIRGGQVTTLADVYSLGVLLYELLTGRRPRRVDEAVVSEPQWRVLDEEPPPPSTVIAAEHAAARRAAPERLRRQLRGDLDHIALMALRTEPGRRYGSVEALLDDLRRHRQRLPVRARPESRLYWARRFVRRHRAGVGAIAASLVVLMTAVVALSLSQRVAVAERLRAEYALAQKEQVTDFLTELFVAADPREARGDTLTVFDLLRRGASRAEALAEQPAVQGHLLHILSHVHERLGDLPEATLLAERALAVRQATFGPWHPEVADSHDRLAAALSAQGHYAAAEPHLMQGLAIRRDLLASDDPDLAESILNVGLHWSYTGRYAEAEELLREALALDRARLGDRHEHVATALNNLAVLLYFKGDYAGSEEAFREALDIRREVYGEPHPRVALTMNNLAAILNRGGDFEAAEKLFRESLDMTRRLVGPGHPDVASTLSNLAAVVGAAGRPAEAEPLLRQAVAIGRSLHEQHPELADALSNLGSTLMDLQRPAEAEPLFAEARDMNAATRGENHPRVALTTYHLGRAAAAQGDAATAERHFRAALAMQEKALPEDHDETANTAAGLGHLLAQQGRIVEAGVLLSRAHASLLATYGEADPRVHDVAAKLADATAPPQ